MAVPVFSGPYTPQVSTVDDAVSFDVSTGWTGADVFEINALPSGFTFDDVMTLGGFVRMNMNYTLFVRGRNSDGVSDWEPLPWTATGLTTARTLYGLSLEYQNLNSSGTAAVLYMLRISERWTRPGELLVNDIGGTDRDGNSARYGSEFVGSQIILSGASDSFIRATEPGWEILIDTS